MHSNISSTINSTGRTGKIARLPQAIRQQLNERLADGESGQELVAWLNGCEAVRERLAQYFDGRPITEQNLSDWKQGGFLDWQRHQEARSMARDFLSEAEELGAEVGDSTLPERTTEVVALVLLKLFREAAMAENGPQQRKAVVEIARELARLRRGEQQRQQVQVLVERDRRQVQAHEELQRAAAARKRDRELEMVNSLGSEYWHEYTRGLDDGMLRPERAAFIEGFFARHAEEIEAVGIDPLPARPPSPSRAERKARGGGGAEAQPVQSDRT